MTCNINWPYDLSRIQTVDYSRCQFERAGFCACDMVCDSRWPYHPTRYFLSEMHVQMAEKICGMFLNVSAYVSAMCKLYWIQLYYAQNTCYENTYLLIPILHNHKYNKANQQMVSIKLKSKCRA